MRTAAKPASLVAVVLATLAPACMAPTEALPRAAAHWAQCLPCHGANGEGDIGQLAPAIAGLPAWYVDAQLFKFREGGRGAHFDDIAGLRMRPMALSLHSNDDVRDMAAYVAQLPTPATPLTITGGDAAAGKGHFALCAACHGADGGGNEMMNAPPIAGRDDWYIYDQLRKFRSGVRGTHKLDTTGPGMRAIALSLPDDKALRDVAHYIAELPNAVTVRPAVVDAVPTDLDAAIKAVGAESKRP